MLWQLIVRIATQLTPTAAFAKLVIFFQSRPANNAHSAPPHQEESPSLLVPTASLESTVPPQESALTALARPTPPPLVKRPAPPARVACGPMMTTLAAPPT